LLSTHSEPLIITVINVLFTAVYGVRFAMRDMCSVQDLNDRLLLRRPSFVCASIACANTTFLRERRRGKASRRAAMGRGRGKYNGKELFPFLPLTRPISRRGGEKKGERSEERETGGVEERGEERGDEGRGRGLLREHVREKESIAR